MPSTLERLTEIFQEVFDDDTITVSRATTAADVDGWESVMHVTLMISVERAFGIRFRSGDVAGLKNVGELADLIDRQVGAR
jgi:acyl carrier protein